MPYLLKTEPTTYSFDDLLRDGETTWDGISNPTRTIRALPQILAAAHRRSLRLVSISTLKSSANQVDAS